MRNRWAISLLLLSGLVVLSSPHPASADDVYLTNGKSFLGVIAEVSDSQVRIRMPGGEIRLARGSVVRVEKADSSYAEYLRRKAAVGRDGDAAAWLALAQWARGKGFDQGVREAALEAASRDPRLPGLAPLLRPLGFVYDERLDRFIPYADAMRRQGYVQSNGQWITREESAQRAHEQEERTARRAALDAAEASRRASEAQRQLAELQLAREAAQATAVGQPEVNGIPLYYGQGFVFVGPPGHHHGRGGRGNPAGSGNSGNPGNPGGPWRQPPPGQQNSESFGYNQLLDRQPGSLLPVGSAIPPVPGALPTPSSHR